MQEHVPHTTTSLVASWNVLDCTISQGYSKGLTAGDEVFLRVLLQVGPAFLLFFGSFSFTTQSQLKNLHPRLFLLGSCTGSSPSSSGMTEISVLLGGATGSVQPITTKGFSSIATTPGRAVAGGWSWLRIKTTASMGRWQTTTWWLPLSVGISSSNASSSASKTPGVLTI